MPRRKADRSIALNTLHELKGKGVVSNVLEARIAYAEADGFRRYVAPLVNVERVHPSVLPTQAVGRWSWKNPPVVNFPDDAKADQRGLPRLRRIFVPDPGTYWLGWDFDALHARIIAAYSGDREDLEAFAKGWDIHTATACPIFGIPLPPDPVDPHRSSSCEGWRKQHGWLGKGDRRRHLAKTGRYSLSYGEDERAILNAPNVAELGLTQAELLRFGRQYLNSKPALVAWKNRVMDECRRTYVARTFLGRRRKLFGKPDDAAREGLNHVVQGAEVDIMESTLIALMNGPYDCRLAYQSHDGAQVVWSFGVPVTEAARFMRPLVERTWNIGGHQVPLTATWGLTRPGGSKENL